MLLSLASHGLLELSQAAEIHPFYGHDANVDR